jgi:hypothetical protein
MRGKEKSQEVRKNGFLTYYLFYSFLIICFGQRGKNRYS